MAGTRKDDKTPRLGGPLDFLRYVWAVDHELKSASKTLARRTGLTERQRLVLKILGKQGTASPGELAVALHVHPSTMTGILQRLTGAGLITRSRNGEDARKGALELTDDGRAASDGKGGPPYEQAVRKALGRFDEASLETTRQVLAAIAEELAVKPAVDARPEPKPSPRGAKVTAAKPAARPAKAPPAKVGKATPAKARR
jgi:DNA-binding MarR family transcriptional regulator